MLSHAAARFRLLLADLLSPLGMLCLGCGRPVHGQLLCPTCCMYLQRRRLPDAAAEQVQGGIRMRSVWRYSSVPRTLVLALKFDPVQAASLPLIQGMAEAARQMKLKKHTLITWVPMPEQRADERCIDHGRVLAEGIAAALALQARPTMRRVNQHHSRPQHTLTTQERLTNVAHDFEALGPLDGPVLLVDDVLTTGSTVQACARCLLAAGAKQVDVVTALRAREPRRAHRAGLWR